MSLHDASGSKKYCRIVVLIAILVGLFNLTACASTDTAATPQESTAIATHTAAVPEATATSAATAEPVLETTPVSAPTVSPSPTAPVQVDNENRYAELAAKIEAAMDALAVEQQFSGTVLVARGGEEIFARGYGYADRQAQTVNDVQTRYRIGSITKQFSAMLVLMLHERGLLDINDPICHYIEDCPDAWSAIKIEHLLTHTSGIPDFTYFPDYESTKGQPTTLPETIDRFRDVPLDFQPAEKWQYTNSGYILIGHIIEQVTGVRYEDFAREQLFGPLDMTNTGYDHNRDDLAVGYVNASGAQADFIDMSIPHAAGALYSTAEDLMKWDRALAEGSLVSADLQDDMFASHAIIPDSGGFGYGYGWVIAEMFGQPVVFHSGGIEGFVSNITRFPQDDTLIVMLSNQEQTNPQAITQTIMQAIYVDE